jgi:two-component system chemotaxis sensor kinase CheA
VVVTAAGNGLIGILVQDVFDTEEIVVKPVAPILRHVTMFSGNTILGDGSVIMILDPNGVARAAGLATRGAKTERVAEAQKQGQHSSDQSALLIFRAGGEPAPKIVPLNLVARLETIAREKIESASGGLVTQYRGRLMKLISMGGSITLGETQSVLVFAEGERSMGLMVDEIVDVVHDRLRIELGSERAGFLGTAVVAGQAADVLDTGYWLTQGASDWFNDAKNEDQHKKLLVVEDSDFFRQLLIPTLTASGFQVTSAANPVEALKLRDAGLMIDAIVSDIEMPEMSGLEFARIVRSGGAWAALPMIALTGRSGADDAQAGRDAGFTDYVGKFDRAALLASLREVLGGTDRQGTAWEEMA